MTFKRILKFRACPCLVALGLAALAVEPAIADDESTTTLNAKLFADVSSIDQKSDGVKVPPSGTGVDVKRFYVGVTHAFDDAWLANITTDFTMSSVEKLTQVYIKKAYFQWTASDALFARVGSADLPWVPFVEELYGYRYIENTLIDRLKFGTSADWGVHAGGKAGDGIFSYAVSLVNGNGYKNTTRSNSPDLEVRAAVTPVAGLTIAADFYSGKLGQDVENIATYNTAKRADAVVAWVNANFRVGAEYFVADNFTAALVTSPTTTDKADGYSVWASYDVTPKVSVFARADTANPSKDLIPVLEDRYYNAGVAFHPRKNVDLAIVAKKEEVDGGSVSTSNGTIGGTTDGEYNEYGLWGQVKF